MKFHRSEAILTHTPKRYIQRMYAPSSYEAERVVIHMVCYFMVTTVFGVRRHGGRADPPFVVEIFRDWNLNCRAAVFV